MKKKYLILILLIALLFSSCSKPQEEEPLLYRDTEMNTILVTNFEKDTRPREMPLMPAEITEQYVEGAYYNGGAEKHRRQSDTVCRLHHYLRTDLLKTSQTLGMQIIQDGRTGQEYFFEVDREDWRTVTVGGYEIFYDIGTPIYGNTNGGGFITTAYWLYDNCLVIVEGDFDYLELMEVLESIIGQKTVAE